jgi:hypothetical protein
MQYRIRCFQEPSHILVMFPLWSCFVLVCVSKGAISKGRAVKLLHQLPERVRVGVSRGDEVLYVPGWDFQRVAGVRVPEVCPRLLFC